MTRISDADLLTPVSIIDVRFSGRPYAAGPENRVLSRVMREILAGSASDCSPLTLHGPPGVGKSHLALGLASSRRKNRPESPIRCENSLDFASEYAEAVRTSMLDRFRAARDSLTLWILEDLRHLEGKPAT
ncbi:MAG: DnaA/Hda family protein, partial [Planctomycetales bacterium]